MNAQSIIDSDSQSDRASSQPTTLTDLLRSRSLAQPDQRAFTFLIDGDTESVSFTYSELDLRARAIGAMLRPLVASGDRVLLLYPPGLDYLAAFFGCLYVGAVAVPAYPPKRNRHMLRLQAIVADAGASVVLTTAPILSRAATVFAQNPYLKPLRWLATDNQTGQSATEWLGLSVRSDDLAFLQYTSGSTGTPKGVMLTHANLLHNAALVYQACQHAPADSYISWLPTFHDMGFMAGILQPLYGGFPVVLMSPASFLQRPLLWLRAISRNRATTSGGPNFAYELCLRKITPEMRATLDLSSWSVAFNGAEPIREKTLREFAEAFASCGFRKEAFFPCYGLAEATLMVSGSRKLAPPVVTTVQAEELEAHRVAGIGVENERGRRLVGCGKTLLGQKIITVNPNTLTECAANEVGEIWVVGPSVAPGYWNRPQDTELTFQAYLPASGEGPFLRTGDLGFLCDGELFVTGRLKDLIIIRGLNHYPQDIEFTVEESHAALRPGCVAAFSVEVAGEEHLVVVQEVDLRKAADQDLLFLIENIRRAISEEHDLKPYAVVLVKPGTIPKTSSGKIQRHASRAAFLESSLEVLAEWRAVISSDENAATVDEMPAFENVADLTAWLQTQLAVRIGLPPSQMDVNQSITGYGLDSILAIELKHRIESGLGVMLPLESFFDGASISQVAADVFARLPTGSHKLELETPGPAEETTAEHHLSRGQQSLWFLHKLAPESSAYHIARAARILSTLDRAALRRAFQALVDRHPSLRTTFSEVNGEPVQRLHENMEVFFEVEDASDWTEPCLVRQLSERANRPFNLETGPLLRVSLFIQSGHEHVLLLTLHHIVTDFWSVSVLIHELGQLYEQEISGNVVALPSLVLQYTDYVRWQEEMLASDAGEELWAYWREQLSGELPPLDLSTDRPRPPVQTYEGASVSFKLDETLVHGLKAIGEAQGATLYMTILAAFLSFLSRYTNQDEVLVGSPTANRNWAALSNVVGYFVNTVVIRSELSKDSSFELFLAEIRRRVLAAFEHQEYPFALLVERLQPERGASRPPIFQAMFVLQKAQGTEDKGLSAFALGEAGARLDLGALSLESLALEQRVAQFDLTLLVTESAKGLLGSFEYNTDLFDRSTIERMADHFQALVGGIVATPACPISQLPLLSPSEHHLSVIKWNDTQRAYPQHRSIMELFELQVARTPERIALICGDEQLTYAELNRLANQLAHHLQKWEVGPEVLVGILAERSREMVVGILGTLKAGGAYLPLDAQYPMERLAFILEDTQMPVLLTQERFIEILPQHQGRTLCLDTQWETVALESDENPVVKTQPENLAYVIYTSGSTGKPKGVAIAHRSTLAFLHWAREHFAPEDLAGVLASTSISFDLSVFELFVPLSWGGTVIMAASALHLPILAAGQQVTLINTVPSAMAELLARGKVPSSVRTVNLAGEQLHNSLVQQTYQQETIAQVFNLYGPSEDTTYSTFTLLKKGSHTPPPIGRPLSNTQIYLLDRQMQPVPVGVVGELYIGGEGLARGYLGRPELTSERFIPHPWGQQAGSRLYRTGDLARYLPDGEIDYLGRIDHQVKLRGFRIELGEIEAVLDQHPSVKECVVITREDNSGDKRLAAYIVLQPGAQPVSNLRSYLTSKLPDYMVPSFFVFLDELPLTSNGKVNRSSLPAPEWAQSGMDENTIAPRTPTEEVLAGIWAEVLEVGRVGIHDNFFELGGHSLLISRVLSRVQDAFRVGLPMRSLFELPTVAELAESIDQARGANQDSPLPSIKHVSREQALPLSYAQQRLWFVDRLGVRNGVYNIPAALRLTGRLDSTALEWSLNEIVRRHESLRTTFQVSEGQPIQIVSEPRPFSLPVIDLRELPESERIREVDRLSTDEALHPFDLAQGPLLRTTLLRLGPDEHVLLLVMHHIVSDGWSVSVLLRELTALYENFGSSEGAVLPELPIQYPDYAVWQRASQQCGSIFDQQLEYWRKALEGAPAILELPTDHPRPPAQSYRGALHPLALGRVLTENLKALSRRENVTLFMLLLAVFQTLLMRYTGRSDVLVSAGVANRHQAETESLIGCLINLLVLRTDLSGDPGFRELLARVREVTLDAYAHQDVPFELVVEALHPERDLSYTPFSQAMLVLQKSPVEHLKLSGLNAELVPIERAAAQFDLTLHLWDGADGLGGFVEYSTDLFDASTIERMAGHLETLLEGVVADPVQHLSALPLLTESERSQILTEWNSTETEFPHQVCLHQLFEAEVQQHPETIAVLARDQQLTYGELNRRANQLAHFLRSLNLGPEFRVGLSVERSTEMVIGILGILKAGGAYVPLDPGYPAERLSFMLSDSQVAVLLTQERLLASMPAHALRSVALDSDWEIVASHSEENPQSVVNPENLAYVIYTSGSTGTPKGIAIRHRGVVNNLVDLNRSFAIGPQDRVMALSSLSFDMCVYEVLGMLTAGGTIVIPEVALGKTPAHWAELISRHQVTVWNSAPSLLEMLVDYVTPRPELHPRSLRVAILGGDWVPVTLPDRLKQLAPNVEVIVLGGATEASIHSIVFPVEATDPSWKSIPYGVPMANQRAYLLDSNLQPVPVGVPGELHLGGIGLARAYHDRPALTAEKFLPNDFSRVPGDRLYKTGDLARFRTDGVIELLGRLDHQVKIRGFRIELGEIKAALKRHPAVQEAVAIGWEDERGNKRLVGYIVPVQGAAPVVAELRDYLKGRLPEYMIPSAFVMMNELPLSPNGKVDRRLLPAPRFSGAEFEKSFIAPRTPMEKVVADIWADLLILDRVGIHDNFFDLGGHSLLATKVNTRLDEIFFLDLPLRLFFEAPTVAELSANLETIGSSLGRDVTRIAETFNELGQLSDDEVRMILSDNGRLQDSQREEQT